MCALNFICVIFLAFTGNSSMKRPLRAADVMIFLIFHCTLLWITFTPSGAAGISNENGKLLCATAECSERARLINASLNFTADRCEDFYSYACGGWLKDHNIPKGNIAFGLYDQLEQDVLKTIKDLLGNLSSVEETPNTVHNLGVMYRRCLDKNDTPGDFANVLKAYGYNNWPMNSTKNGDPGWNLTDFFNNSGINTLFELDLVKDPENASKPAIKIGHKPIGISTGDELIKYNQLIMELVSSVNSSYDNVSLQNFADRINEIEALLFNLSKPVNGALPTASMASISELQKNFSNIPLLEMLNEEFSKLNITLNESESVFVDTLYYYEQLNEFLAKASSDDLEMLYNYAPIINLYFLLEHASRKIRKSFAAAERTPFKHERNWDDCYTLLRKSMPEVIEYVYINSTSSLDVRNEVLKIAERIRETFNATIENADWMKSESKAILQQKLKDIAFGIGCPDYILNITYIDRVYKHVPRFSINTTILEMMYFLKQNNYLKQLVALREPRHSDSLLQSWQKSALDLGAFYYPPENRIEIPWAMFRPPFFQRGVPRSLNFGAIGGLIAHEMLHAFDASAMILKKVGSNVTLDSNDTAAFKNKTKCFFNQYKNASETLWKVSISSLSIRL
ncbi:membrane metallo-endopeptidase-like 1 [Dermacentor silvarum]|uniref:membrane metallo-endopeptidase-like 1 n=1 Tax=Dermacentor silvarum TaxID=543639 RepID=UPI0021018A95|nr:membrane metallo-endopeptidase-like 1 [Dermacentor silvarum]